MSNCRWKEKMFADMIIPDKLHNTVLPVPEACAGFGSCTRKTSHCQYIASVILPTIFNNFIPYITRTGESGNKQDRLTSVPCFRHVEGIFIYLLSIKIKTAV